MALIKHFEFWPARVFETPYYLYLLWRCLRHGLSPKDLAKANYALDHGELGLGSKFTSQMSFDQTHFLPTLFIESNNIDQASVDKFVEDHGFPLILKPDNGAVGKGIVKLDSAEALAKALAGLHHNHLLQKFTTANYEYGVFYVRQRGKGMITGINRKHFPTVTGDGKRTIAELAAAHPRHTDHWPLFLRYVDTQHIP